MDKTPISLSISEGVAVLSMARPPVNAMSKAFMAEFDSLLTRFAEDRQARALIITSALPGMFSGGADIREMGDLGKEGCEEFVRLGQRTFGRIGDIPKPVIAAVNGVCVGGGLELSMSCDLRLAAKSARFGQPEVNLGLVPGWGGSQRLPRLVGKTRGLEMLWLGEPISAEEAFQIGLVNRVVPDDDLMSEATDLAGKLSGKSPTGLAKIKESVQRGLTLPLTEGLKEEARCYVESYLDGEAKEGIAAFLEKRPAHF